MYVKYPTREAAQADLPTLQAYHDDHVKDTVLVDIIVEVDGAFYLTLRDGDEIMLSGEIVESTEQPIDEGVPNG